MKQFQKIIMEVNRTLNKVLFFNILINAVLVFLAFYLLMFIFSFFPVFALLPGLMYLIIAVYVGFARKKVKEVENAYKPLDEKLRTAADNIQLENPVVDELQKEVQEELRNVRVSSFFNVRKVSQKMLGIVLLCFLIVFLSTINLDFLDFRILSDKVVGYLRSDELGNFEPGTELGAGGGNSQDIYGEESIAALGEEELKLEIKQINYEININDIKDVEEKSFKETFPEEVFAQATAGFEENIPIEQYELVKEYFKRVSQE